MTVLTNIGEALTFTPVQALEVVISTIGIYCSLLLLIRLIGQRAVATLSSFDFAAVIALGAIAGRAILGYTPTLGAGALALVVLFALQAFSGQIRRTRWGARIVTNRPLLLMAGDKLLTENLARAHIAEDELRSKLRLAGIRSLSEVSCVVLESTGAMSILRRGEPVDPSLLQGVVGAEVLLPDLP